ncbi:MAG: DegT/DnrJ/EryC1/StrS family aminotransferase [Planctomycetota bacterium]
MALPHDSIPLSRPDISALERRLVDEVLRSGRLALGPMTERFEAMVAARADCEIGVATNSGTSALQLMLLGLGIGAGDEVITSPLSFIASANPILHVGATPVFVDVCPKTLNADPAKLEAAITPKTRAIMAVEAFGNPAYMDKYAQIAAKHEIALLEDSCEALGARHAGRPCGSFGRAGAFGFYPNKQITTGEGGMLVTDDSALADAARSLRNQGRDSFPSSETGGEGPKLGAWLQHQRIGFNYRMSEVSAAIGVGQMQRFDEIIERRQRVASMYIERLAGNEHIVLPTVLPNSEPTWFVFVVRLAAGYTAEERDRVITGLRNHDIGAAPYFPCIHLQKPYRDMFGFREGHFPVSESIAGRTIALPFFGDMTPREVDLVGQTLEVMLSRENLTRS